MLKMSTNIRFSEEQKKKKTEHVDRYWEYVEK